MIAIVAPEPVDWLAPLCAALAPAAEPIAVFAPWALDQPAPGFLPEAIARFWNRRVLATSAGRVRPEWLLGDALLRAWSGTTVDRVMRARVWRRRAADRLAARWLAPEASLVIAPSLGARATLAAAQARGQRTALVEDLPSLRELHADLDVAAARWPDSRFLRRYRAPGAWIAEQEAERVLADVVIVRSAYAERTRRGSHAHVVGLRPSLVPVARGSEQRPRRTVLLAGPAAARNGTNELLGVLADHPELVLLVQPGEGTEPADLLQRNNIRAATLDERTTFAGVDVVAAPAWCEGHFPQLLAAAAQGLPVVATDRAAGFVAATLVPCGDVATLAHALMTATTLEPAPTPSFWQALTTRPAPNLRRARLPIV